MPCSVVSEVAAICVGRSAQLLVLCAPLLTHCQQPQQPLQQGCLRRKLPSSSATPAAAVVLVVGLVLLVVLLVT